MTSTPAAIAENNLERCRMIGRIPVRNIWLLFLYASNFGHYLGRFDADVERSPDLPTLVGRLLAHAVERRLRRNLSRGYQSKHQILSRVRGRIDLLTTLSQELLQRGQIACRFEEFTIDTPRNQFVRAALDAVSSRVNDPDVSHRCRTLAGDLGRLGVGGLRPSRSEMASDQISRNDAEDRLMVTLAGFVFDLVLPTEDSGNHELVQVAKDEVLVRKLFERAVGNFFAAELPASKGWRVYQGKCLDWPIEEASTGLLKIMPGMKTDIILENHLERRQIIVDTKFTGIFASSLYREKILKSGYIYQIYTYLRSQEASGPLTDNAEGLLLHPSIGSDVDECALIQGHRIRFGTVNLAATSESILKRLRSLVDGVEEVVDEPAGKAIGIIRNETFGGHSWSAPA